MQNNTLFPVHRLPRELFVNHILPHVAKDWLYVSKGWYRAASDVILSDRRVKPNARENHPIRQAASSGNFELVSKLLKDARVCPSAGRNAALRNAVAHGHVHVAKLLMRYPMVNPAAAYNECIIVAALKCNLRMCELLLGDDRVDPSASQNEAIRLAAYGGSVDIVDLLLRDHRVNPSDQRNAPIADAARRGHLLVVERLLKDVRVDPSVGLAFVFAVCQKQYDIVNLLLNDQRVDPSQWNNLAIHYASEDGQTSLVARLLADPRVSATFRNTESSDAHDDNRRVLSRGLEAVRVDEHRFKYRLRKYIKEHLPFTPDGT